MADHRIVCSMNRSGNVRDNAAMESFFSSQNGCRATGAEFGAGIRYAVEKGWLELHESGTFLKLLPHGEDLLKR